MKRNYEGVFGKLSENAIHDQKIILSKILMKQIEIGKECRNIKIIIKKIIYE